MPDPTRPTQRSPKASLSGSSPGLKTVKSITPKPGSTGPVPTARASTTRRSASGAKAEVIASSDDIELSSVRQKMAATGGRLRGISLRWKIVASMVGITVATAILILIVVYNKAVSQLEDEIDVKGVRLVKTLATIDPSYWKYAIHYQPEEGKRKIDAILKAIPDVQFNEVAKQRLFNERQDLKSYYDELSNPLGELHPLKGNPKDYGPGSDIIQMSVIDVSGAEKAGVSAVEVKGGNQRIVRDDAGTRPSIGGVEISDGTDKSIGTKVRLFSLRQAAGSVRLEYFVVLSLERIIEARSSLRTAIFVPIIVSALLGIAIAVWISTLITEPIKALVQDMQEVSAGNLDHHTVAHSSDEIGMLATTFNRMTQAIHAAHEQEMNTKALEHDLSIASEIQSNLVPKRMLKVPGYDISAYYRPSKEVGGDYYDFLTINEDLEGIIVADVSGKGVPGSLVMTMARAFIRMESEQHHNPSPGVTLTQVNRMLAQDIKKGMFVTAIYCILDKKTNEIRVASAGHNPLIVWRAAANKIQLVNPPGIALGFDKGPVFERTVKEEKLVLDHGDRIVAYTDGTVEAMNAANQEFGDGRFQNLIQQLSTRDSNQMLNLLVKALDEHKGDAPQSDDITVVTLRYL